MHKLARLKQLNWPIQRAGKLFCPDVNVRLTGKASHAVGQPFSIEKALNINEKRFKIFKQEPTFFI